MLFHKYFESHLLFDQICNNILDLTASFLCRDNICLVSISEFNPQPQCGTNSLIKLLFLAANEAFPFANVGIFYPTTLIKIFRLSWSEQSAVHRTHSVAHR